jgi:hypothetical protein
MKTFFQVSGLRGVNGGPPAGARIPYQTVIDGTTIRQPVGTAHISSTHQTEISIVKTV